jgi:hypothetical protein
MLRRAPNSEPEVTSGAEVLVDLGGIFGAVAADVIVQAAAVGVDVLVDVAGPEPSKALAVVRDFEHDSQGSLFRRSIPSLPESRRPPARSPLSEARALSPSRIVTSSRRPSTPLDVRRASS